MASLKSIGNNIFSRLLIFIKEKTEESYQEAAEGGQEDEHKEEES